MAEVNDTPQISDEKSFVKPNITADVTPHIEETQDHEKNLVNELSNIGAAAAGEHALSQHLPPSNETTQALSESDPTKMATTESSRWDKIRKLFLAKKEGLKNAA